MKKLSKKLVFSSIILVIFLSLTSFKDEKRIEKKWFTNVSKTIKQEIIGTYILKSCENSRFKIKIEKKSGIYSFLIYDKNKIISKGKIKKQTIEGSTYLTFGKIEGLYEDDKIQIQNYGNSMNEYIHFTQCLEKYLSFVKSQQ